MSIGEVIAKEARRLREARGWKQQDLADRLAELGAPLNRVTLAKIESGGTRAANLSVADMMALAAALDTSPVSLVFPAGRVEIVEVTPQLRIFSGHASKWFCAEEALTDENRNRINSLEWSQATWGTRAYRESDRLSKDVEETRKRVADAGYVGDQDQIKTVKAAHVEALRALERLYREMERDGLTPPGETRKTVDDWKAIHIEVPAHWLWDQELEEGES